MPDSDVRRMTAPVPSRSGAYGSSTVILTAAWLSSVRVMSRTEPTRRPPTCTSSSLTSCPALWNSSVYSVPPPDRKRSSQTMSTTTSARALAAAALATVTYDAPSSGRTLPSRSAGRAGTSVQPERLFHAQRALGSAAQELAHELVVGAEEVLGRTGLHDPAAPQ